MEWKCEWRGAKRISGFFLWRQHVQVSRRARNAGKRQLLSEFPLSSRTANYSWMVRYLLTETTKFSILSSRFRQVIRFYAQSLSSKSSELVSRTRFNFKQNDIRNRSVDSCSLGVNRMIGTKNYNRNSIHDYSQTFFEKSSQSLK